MRSIKTILSVFFAFLFCISAMSFALPEAKAANETFIIDVGHGGNDPGAGGHGREEADDVLKLSLKVGEYLKPYTTFVFTRTTDTTLSLKQRSSMANSGGYDYIISIHRNCFSDQAAKGLETWWYSGTYGGNPSACKKFATAVYDAVMEEVPVWTRRGVRDGNLHMCREPLMPSCLIETGFISNITDNDIFDKYFDQNAFGIAKGMLAMIGITPSAGAVETWQEKAAFDTMVYRDSNPDIAHLSDADLKKHWLESGIKEGRRSSPVLDLKFYLNNNKDLQDAFGTDYEKVYNHFIKNGYKEKRKSSALFDGQYYCDNNPEIYAKFGDDYMKHYAETGIKEGRRGSLTFDPDYYWFLKPEVWDAWPAHYELCAKHYAGYGVNEGVEAYDNKNPVISDVKVSNVSASGYTITCTVTDNWGIEFVSFPTWTVANNQDDLAADFFNTQRGTKNGDVYTFVVKASEHNNETGEYVTHIYAQDLGGNRISYNLDTIEVKDGAVVTPTLDTIKLNSGSSYKVDGSIVKNVDTKTSVNSFVAQFENNDLVVKNKEGKEISGNSIVGTGATINLYLNGSLVDSITIIVFGDVDGTGSIDSTDYIRVKSSLTGGFSMTDTEQLAADVDNSEVVNSVDYIRIKTMLVA